MAARAHPAGEEDIPRFGRRELVDEILALLQNDVSLFLVVSVGAEAEPGYLYRSAAAFRFGVLGHGDVPLHGHSHLNGDIRARPKVCVLGDERLCFLCARPYGCREHRNYNQHEHRQYRETFSV